MANSIEVKDLLEAGVHFGHLTRKWNPNMAPYIYMERNGIHVINLYKTAAKIEEANEALKKIAASGRKILFVATKKQAKDIVAEKATSVGMPYITERWPGGMLTNFVTIRKAVKKMSSIDKMKKDGTYDTLSKKEKLHITRLREKLEKNLGSIADMTRLPAALFVVDTLREHIAVKEAYAMEHGLETISDLKKVESTARTGFSLEFNDRPDGKKGLESLYGLKLNIQTMEPALRYQALEQDKLDIIEVYSTDSQIIKYGLKLLQDDKHLFPPYQGAPLMREETLKQHPELEGILNKLHNKITATEMATMNYQVDVEGKSAKEVAHDFLSRQGLLK